MQVQILENWSEISGTVRSREPSPDMPNFARVTIAVKQVTPVAGVANMLERVDGTDIVVHVPRELVASLSIAPGDVIRCRVRRAAHNRMFVHGEHVSVEHPGG
jgi:hypothetical protein